MIATVTKKEINEVIESLKNGSSFINEVADYQFVLKKDGTMFKYQKGKYTFYDNLEKFAKAIVRTVKRGF